MAFKLQFILDEKNAELDEIKMELAQVQSDLQQNTTLRDEKFNALQSLESTDYTGLTGWELRQLNSSCDLIYKSIGRIDAYIKMLEKDLESISNRFNEIRADIKLYEKLKEKYLLEEKKKKEAKEAKRLDEYVINTYARGFLDEY